MSDPLIEGIAYTSPEPEQGVVNGLRNLILPANTDTDTEGVEEKRESLAILASLGTAKDYLGVQMSLGDVKKLSPKDVEKFYYRYQSVLGKQLTGGLVESAIKLASKVFSKVISIDDANALSNDLLQDELVRRELITAAGYLVLKGGRFIALASALFHIVSHMNFTIDEKSIVEKPEGLLSVNVGVNEKSKAVGIKHNLGDSKVKLPHSAVKPPVVIPKKVESASMQSVPTESKHETNISVYMIAAVALGWYFFR